jgi:hypothetical protein
LSQFGAFVADVFNAWEFAFITHNNEMMADNIWNGWDGYYRYNLGQNEYQWFWKTQGEGFSPAFRVYVDSIIAEAG